MLCGPAEAPRERQTGHESPLGAGPLLESVLREIPNEVRGWHAPRTLLKRGAHPCRRESAPGRRRDGGLSALLDGERRVSTSVGVVDHGVEGLIDPLPEHHGRRRPGTERPVRRPPSPATAPRGRAENASTGRGQRGGGRPGGWAGSCRPCFPVTSFGSYGQRHARKVTAWVELTNLNLILNV